MANQIGFVNAVNELCNNETTTFQNDSFIPVFRKNGTENIVEKFLGKNLPSGGSSDSSMPKNVIVINSDVAEVEGKVYNSFANAKTYMEENPYETFKVELPAGDFSEAISLDSQWIINGNNTNLTSPITTTDIVAKADIGQNIEYRIKNWTISGGFTSTATEEGMFSIFYLSDCELKNNSCSTTPVVILCDHCIIDSNEDSYCILITVFSVLKKCKFISLNASHSFIAGELIKMQSPMQNLAFVYCTLAPNADVKGESFFAHCEFTEGSKISNISLSYCGGKVILSSDIAVDRKRLLNQSDITLDIGDGVSTVYVNLSSSRIEFRNTSFSTGYISLDSNSTIYADNSTIPMVYATANSNILGNGSITTIYKPNLYMYSTDGGISMTDDPTEATYVGTVKNPNTIYVYPVTVTNYIWIPLK